MNLWYLLLFFVPVAAVHVVEVHVNATVNESVVLPCSLETPKPVNLTDLVFYWQDEKGNVLFHYAEGRVLHQDRRCSVAVQDMINGNISITLHIPTLQDNQKFHAYGKLSKSQNYSRTTELCQISSHVAAPYRAPHLTVNETMNNTLTLVCTTEGGFPEPHVTWRSWNRSDNSEHVLDQSRVHTEAEREPGNAGYRVKSTVTMPEGEFHNVTCFIYNPTTKITLNATHSLNTTHSPDTGAGLTTPQIIGVVIGVVGAVGAVSYFIYRRRQRPEGEDHNRAAAENQEDVQLNAVAKNEPDAENKPLNAAAEAAV